jgi:ATP-dependent protease ClpP protease subunit
MIYLAGEINTEMYLDLMKRLDKRPNRINLMINSCGGGLCSALGMYDRLRMVKDCTITANGDCSSAALVILQAAKIRRATLHSNFTFHLTSISPECSCEDCVKHPMSKEDMAIKTTLDIIIQKIYRYRISEDNMIRAFRQNCFGVEKALEYGFIDEIYTGEKCK